MFTPSSARNVLTGSGLLVGCFHRNWMYYQLVAW